MIGADTNILARFLVKDIDEQSAKVNDLLDKGETIYINSVVLSELTWVLLNVYDYSKIAFIQVLDLLLETEGFYFFDQRIVKESMIDYLNTTADFNDCLITQINKAQNIETYTFDKKASKLSGMKLLG